VKISFEKSWAYPPAFIWKRLSEGCCPKTSLHNQQDRPGKYEDSDFEGKGHPPNQETRKKIGEPASKHMP